ncbi:MAG: hypothetical protein ACKKL5_01130 [Candidatus Komeilibacteria bacterium]
MAQLIDNKAINQDDSSASGNIYTMPAKFTKPTNSKSSRKIFIIAAIIVGLVVIAGGAYWFINAMQVPTDNIVINDQRLNNNMLLNNSVAVDNNINEQQSPVSDDIEQERDEQRLQDIFSLRSALAIYYVSEKVYPDKLEDLIPTYLQELPQDPLADSQNYVYIGAGDQTSYQINFSLESGGKVGNLNLPAGDYVARADMIEPLVPDVSEDDNDNASVDDMELLAGLDSDRDALSDIEENIYKTDAALVDTDGDGYSDANELVKLFDPALPDGALLVDSANVSEYFNSNYNYSIYYPTVWNERELTEDKAEVLFSSATTEMIQVIVQDNPLGLSARDWYIKNNPEIDPSGLQDVVFDNMVGVQTEDGLHTYLALGSDIYVLVYNLGTTNQLNYLATYQMMLASFKLVEPASNDPAVLRDQQRQQDVSNWRLALLSYQVDNLSLPDSIDADVDTFQILGNGSDCAMTCSAVTTATACVDMSGILVPSYLESLPQDPSTGSMANTGYYVNLLTDGTVIVGACQPETMDIIEVSN